MAELSDSSSIAVFFNAQKLLAGPSTATEVVIYSRGDREWLPAAQYTFNLVGCNKLAQFHERLGALVTKLGTCRIIIGARDNGVSYSILNKLDFNICQLDLFEVNSLEYVRTRVLNALKKAAAEKDGPVVTFIKELSPGHFFLDLTEAKQQWPQFTSRGVLSDFFESTIFEELSLKCDHTPRWLNDFIALAKLGLRQEKQADGVLHLIIYHLPGHNPAELTGVKWFAPGSCSCGN
ncbi:MAG: hypothetical protein AMR96_01935 [Candidatus Adiutrix intracellularis]|jgi:hypothetical protein|nr:MAG: hypothetical protein AMR96_01935 [Candidatus Adiutrix intracellularis]MDR2827147.1 hypothetical protein [Candidatus Adiutrix intracellularis]